MQHDLKTEAGRALRLIQDEWRAIKEDPGRKQILIEGETNLIEAVQERKWAITAAESEIARIEEEIAKATEKKRRALEDLANLRNGLAEALYPIGSIMVGNKLVTPAKSPDSVELLDESLIPDAFMTEKVAKKPNKTAIKKALQSGDAVPGAKLVTGKVKVTL